MDTTRQRPLRTLHLFAGAGGGILADNLLGHIPVCSVEIEPYCRKILLARQRDGILPRFPIWDDVCTFSGREWRGYVDIVCGGFPCQDISAAYSWSARGGRGLDGKRSGLWAEMARIIGEVRPRQAFVENSPLLTGRGLDIVLMDLAEMGYDAKWGVFGADDVGAPHRRKRIWILAVSNSQRLQGQWADDQAQGRQDEGRQAGLRSGARVTWWDQDPAEDGHEALGKLGRVASGVAYRVDRLKAIGNGQVALVAARAYQILNSHD